MLSTGVPDRFEALRLGTMEVPVGPRIYAVGLWGSGFWGGRCLEFGDLPGPLNGPYTHHFGMESMNLGTLDGRAYCLGLNSYQHHDPIFPM